MRTLMAAILVTLLVAAASIWYGSGSDLEAERNTASAVRSEKSPPSEASKSVAGSDLKAAIADRDEEPAPFWNSGRPLTDF